METENKWHNADYDKPKSGTIVLLRVEKHRDPSDVLFITGYHSGYEYCDEGGRSRLPELTHYDRVTHWIELP